MSENPPEARSQASIFGKGQRFIQFSKFFFISPILTFLATERLIVGYFLRFGLMEVVDSRSFQGLPCRMYSRGRYGSSFCKYAPPLGTLRQPEV